MKRSKKYNQGQHFFNLIWIPCKIIRLSTAPFFKATVFMPIVTKFLYRPGCRMHQVNQRYRHGRLSWGPRWQDRSRKFIEQINNTTKLCRKTQNTFWFAPLPSHFETHEWRLVSRSRSMLKFPGKNVLRALKQEFAFHIISHHLSV